ncbi:MAG: hypothetical protein WCY88_16660 [Spongiibacteraceae bacterium]
MTTGKEEIFDLKLLDKILEEAAENIGDIHPIIMNKFLTDYQKSSEIFSHHGGVHVKSMQNTMIDWGLYCLIGWINYKGEAKSVLTDAIRQHKQSSIDPQLTRGLMKCIFTVIGQNINPSSISELRLWNRIESEILDFLLKIETENYSLKN